MKLDIAQAKIFAVLLSHFLADEPVDPAKGAVELGIPLMDFDVQIHWPRVCARLALRAMKAVESEVSNTPSDERGM